MIKVLHLRLSEALMPAATVLLGVKVRDAVSWFMLLIHAHVR